MKNLERDPRATLQVEAGVDYAELRGVMLRCDVVLHRDLEVVDGHRDGARRPLRAAPGRSSTRSRDGFRQQAPKRVALEFVERDRVTWDHRKLGGAY